MAKIYYQQDCNLFFIKRKTVAIIGHVAKVMLMLNAKDSGVHVIIGLYEGSKSWASRSGRL